VSVKAVHVFNVASKILSGLQLSHLAAPFTAQETQLVEQIIGHPIALVADGVSTVPLGVTSEDVPAVHAVAIAVFVVET